MRLETFINEERHTEIYFDTDNVEEKVAKMAHLLFNDCKEYLKDLGKSGEVMYRGAYGDDMTKIVPRKNRQPTDMSRELQEELDNVFYDQFKWRPRSEGVFCSGEWDQAHGYGNNVFTVWPIGKYQFLYNENIHDLYTYFDTENELDDVDTDQIERDYYDNYGEGYEGTWYYEGDDTKESDKDNATDVVAGWFEKDHEPEDDEDDYDGHDDVDYNGFEWEPDVSWDDYLEDNIEYERERIRENRLEVVLDYKDDDIKKAIKSKHEIMVRCKEYYIIDEEFTDDLNKLLKIGKIKPVHKQLKFQFAYKKRRPKR